MSIKRLLFNRLNLINAVVLLLIVLLAKVNSGVGMNPNVMVFVPSFDGSSFNMPTQILVAMASVVVLGVVCTLVLIAITWKTVRVDPFYVRYTCVLFCVSNILGVLTLACPTIPGAEERIASFAAIATLTFILGFVDALFALDALCAANHKELFRECCCKCK